MVKNQRKTKANAAAPVPRLCERLGFDSAESTEVLMSAATRNSETPWMTKEIKSDLRRPMRSMTRAAAAVPKMPNVLTKPPIQADLYASKPASSKRTVAHVAMTRMPVHCWIC